MIVGARDYQLNGIEAIRNEFRAGHLKVLLWLATGAGKTFVFCRMVKEAAAKGKRCLVVVRGRKLVDQASERLFREGVHHGVFMSGHWNYRPTMPIQVCSIDTVLARKVFPPADLIIIDECHQAMSPGYKQFLASYPEAFVVAVTATPFVKGSMRHFADRVVHPITMQELIDRGFLVPFRYFAPSHPDLSELKIVNQDYHNIELGEVMSAESLTGDIVTHWKKIASGLPTIGFAVNVRHSKLMVEKCLQAGIRAEHVDADSTDQERNEAIKRVQDGTTEILWNVGILCTGVDITCLRAIISARPTKSRNLFIQQAGRGTRLHEGKSNCILLDHAGNLDQHGLPTDDDDEIDLDGKKKKQSKPRETKTCKNCFAMFRAAQCPECGVVIPAPELGPPEEADGQLVEMTAADFDPVERTHRALLKEARKHGRKAGWAHYKLIDKFGFDKARPHLPQWVIDKEEGPQNFVNSRYHGKKFTGF